MTARSLPRAIDAMLAVIPAEVMGQVAAIFRGDG